ncbi:CPR5 [Candida pseudojiufengensis]|uniref:CPR5 n=1 Tax=Candida pseudojiufengensis TaxID=497109 RepID=UPI0022241299|nr:CPR5 [Candida pseudojiufengensis]KAI5959502.1 CPR5 [Candida pseudojiufengensis]
MMLVTTILLFISLIISSIIPETSFSISKQEQKHVEGDPKVTHKIIFSISQGNENDQTTTKFLGKLTLGLFGEIVPITVENFYQLSTMTQGFGYKNSKFHRIINNFMIQGGDIIKQDGTGSQSIYGEKFNDENFLIKHDKLGRLSMANSGPNTNGCQFFITNIEKIPHLDGIHVVFGQLIDGFDTLNKISNVEVDSEMNKPMESIFISDIQTSIFDKDLQEAKEKSNQLKSGASGEEPQDDLKIDEEIKKSSSLYPLFFIILLMLALGGIYFKKVYKRETITDIRSNRKF